MVYKTSMDHDLSIFEIFKELKLKSVRRTYMISNFGRVISIFNGNKRSRSHTDILKPRGHSHGYLRVHLVGKDFYIHRLVAEFFCEKKPGKNLVNHKDGNKKNNIYTNLEWCNPEDNVRHAYATGLQNGRHPNRIAAVSGFKKTHCKHGHLFTQESFYTCSHTNRKRRRCKECDNIRSKNRHKPRFIPL